MPGSDVVSASPGPAPPFTCGEAVASVVDGRVVVESCPAAFLSASALDRHRRVSHKHHTCPYCLTGLTHSAVNRHVRACAEGPRRMRKCVVCGERMSGEALRAHMLSAHAHIYEELSRIRATRDRRRENYLYRGCARDAACDLCGMRFSTASNMRRHRKTCWMPRAAECPTCEKPFHVRRFFSHHVATRCAEDRPTDD